MNCSQCQDIVDRSDVPHVVRFCSCGRELHVVETGDHGKGIRIREGDRFVIPVNWLTLSLNPLKNRGRLTRAGIQMLAENMFIDGITAPPHRDNPWDHLREVEERSDQIVNSFEPIQGLDVNNREDAEAIHDRMLAHRDDKAFYAYVTGFMCASVRNARSENNLDSAVWSAICAERFWAMFKYKDGLEDVVWMGHSVSRLKDVLAIWDSSQTNPSEEFWQETFKEHSFVLSQIFAEPVIFIRDKAYVGGMTLDRTDARFVDYLFSVESSREAILIEIKTPETKLLSGEYRGNRLPSRELVGAAMQVWNYRTELIQSLRGIAPPTALEVFAPKAVLIIGNQTNEFTDANDRKMLDLFRGTLRDVQVITFDELFRKVEILASLFSLKRDGAPKAG